MSHSGCLPTRLRDPRSLLIQAFYKGLNFGKEPPGAGDTLYHVPGTSARENLFTSQVTIRVPSWLIVRPKASQGIFHSLHPIFEDH